jgi:hypothetical protein
MKNKFLFLFLIIPITSFGNGFNLVQIDRHFDYRKPLFDDQSRSNEVIQSRDNLSRKSIITNSVNNASIGEEEPMEDSAPDQNSSRMRFLLSNGVITFQIVHESGFGVGANNIHLEPKGKENGYEIDTFAYAPSYTYLQENYSIGLGIAKFQGKAAMNDCSSSCYGDEIEVTGTLNQVIFSFNYNDYLELLMGFNQLDYLMLDPVYDGNSWGGYIDDFSENTISIGAGYVF